MARRPRISGTPRRLPVLILAAACAASCGTDPKRASSPPTTRPAPAGPVASSDACAVRLHDLCGAFLLHYAARGRLPDSLDALRETSSALPQAALQCPGTDLAYAYDAQGIPILKSNLRVIVYDPVLTHGSTRWAVAIEEPEAGGALVTKVLRLPDAFFEAR